MTYHCPQPLISSPPPSRSKQAGSLLVRLGDSSGGDLSVTEVALHVDWGGKARYHDLAVLRLAAPVLLGPGVMPACLGPATLDPGAPFLLSGCQTVQIVDGRYVSGERVTHWELVVIAFSWCCSVIALLDRYVYIANVLVRGLTL